MTSDRVLSFEEIETVSFVSAREPVNFSIPSTPLAPNVPSVTTWPEEVISVQTV